MELDIARFYQACNPSRPLAIARDADQPYYVDFSQRRGGVLLRNLARPILMTPDAPTCQLFAGHAGSGKSTELLRLQFELESKGFQVTYFEASQSLDLVDAGVTDVLLGIAGAIARDLADRGILLVSDYLHKLWQEALEQFALDEWEGTPLLAWQVLDRLLAAIACGHEVDGGCRQRRQRVRQYLEPRTGAIAQAIDAEIVRPAIARLKQQGKKGLAILADNLDRIGSLGNGGGMQPERLFVDRGDRLAGLPCHKVFTIPMALALSRGATSLRLQLGGGVAPKLLPMVAVRTRDRKDDPAGLQLLRQMVLVRAFPGVGARERSRLLPLLFEDAIALDRLCRASGGHVRTLLGLLRSCLQYAELPLSEACVEAVLQDYSQHFSDDATEEEWVLLREIDRGGTNGKLENGLLLRHAFVCEYRDERGRWFCPHPLLALSERFQNWQQGWRG